MNIGTSCYQTNEKKKRFSYITAVRAIGAACLYGKRIGHGTKIGMSMYTPLPPVSGNPVLCSSKPVVGWRQQRRRRWRPVDVGSAARGGRSICLAIVTTRRHRAPPTSDQHDDRPAFGALNESRRVLGAEGRMPVSRRRRH